MVAAPRIEWIWATTAAPSPTAEATRLVEPERTSPTAKSPGWLVSNGSGIRPNAVVIEIRGDIWNSPMPDSLYVKTEIDLESGSCHLQDKQYG